MFIFALFLHAFSTCKHLNLPCFDKIPDKTFFVPIESVSTVTAAKKSVGFKMKTQVRFAETMN